MIRVRAVRKNDRIQSVTVTGHAGAGAYGHDLVCATVSGIMVGLCNAMVILTSEDNIIVDEGRVEIHVGNPNEKTDLILETGLIQLKTAEEVNQDYLKVTEV